MKGRCIFIVIFIFWPIILFSSEKIKVELIDQFYLDQSREFLGKPGDIAIDDHENIFVTDRSTSDIKAYNSKGLLLTIIGQKGGGPGEFLEPYTIDYDKGKFCIQDIGLYKYLIFNNKFEEEKRFFYLIDGNDFVLQDDRIISNDYFNDKEGNDFRGIILDFSGKVKRALMPIAFSKNDGWNRITDSIAFVDVSKNGEIYLVKERRISFFKFDKEGTLIKKFGKNPTYFISCKKTKDFDKATSAHDPNVGRIAWERWRRSFTWVSGIFVLEDILGIVIRKYNKNNNVWNCFLQFYDFEGNLLNQDIELKEPKTSSDYGFLMDSNHKDRIYILEVFEEEEPRFKFYKYEVKWE